MKAFYHTFYCSVIFFLLFPISASKGQELSYVISTNFTVNCQDTSYRDLAQKLPAFICEGVFTNSMVKLKRIESGKKIPVQSGTENKSGSTNSVAVYYNALLDSLDYMMEGEITILNGRFFVYYYVTNFRGVEFSYTSKTVLLKDFLNIMDEACSYLNSKIRNVRYKNAKSIFITDFVTQTSDLADARYTADFPAQYLSIHLEKPGISKFSVLPRDFDIRPSQSVINVGGTIQINSEQNRCIITPVIYFTAKDSLVLTPIEDDIENIDELQRKTVHTVRSFLDIAIKGDTVNTSFIIKGTAEEKVYINHYEKALQNGQPLLAYYYANQMELHYSNNPLTKLMKAKIKVEEGDCDAASTLVAEFLKKEPENIEANYIAGICAVNDGNFSAAQSYLNKVIRKHPGYKQAYYQKGLSLYYEGNPDSLRTALSYFLKQRPVKENIVKADLYYNISKCYQDLTMTDSSEYYLLKMYQVDTTDKEYKKRLGNFYHTLASKKFEQGNYSNAYTYASKAYLYSKDRKILETCIQSMILLKNKPEKIDSYIKSGIEDYTLNKATVYLSLNDFCKKQKLPGKNEYDPYYLNMANSMLRKHIQCNPTLTGNTDRLFGSNYYRLQKFDSAEYYYHRIKLADPKNPINYFNIVEVQLIQNKLTDAIANLKHVKPLISDKTDTRFNGLYYLYMIEAKILKGESYSEEKNHLNTMINQYTGDKSKIIYGWNFMTFYNWVNNNKNINSTTRKELSSNLCYVIQYSPDKNLPCP